MPGGHRACAPHKPISTQEAFGRVLVDLARDSRWRRYLVTTAPDVATSTNLAGFINKTGVFAPTERRSWSQDRMLRWTESPAGQHIELGISEMNLFLLLGQLGLVVGPVRPAAATGRHRLRPVRAAGLDAFLYGTYSGSRFVVAGTPSGVTLAPEGGAHQSTITASVGLELPGVTFVEPAYATAWTGCSATRSARSRRARGCHRRAGRGRGVLLPVEHPPVDQTPFEAARARLGDAVLRRQVLAGAYRLVDAHQASRAAWTRRW